MKSNKKNKFQKQRNSENGTSSSKDFFEEFQLQEQETETKFNIVEYLYKKECTSYSFGKILIEQKAYICSVCDPKKKNFMCRYCYKFCHKKCRENLVEEEKALKKKEKKDLKKFFCHCGVIKKHSVEMNLISNKNKCGMMQLDQELGINPYTCVTHDMVVCCICAVVCHKDCTITSDIQVEEVTSCNCVSDFHSKLNEMALSFPLEKYKKISNVDIWPIQILNLLFSGKIFNNMKDFFSKFLNNEIDFKKQNKAIVKKFADLLELFANTFNSQFKSYYYHDEIIKMFQYNKLFLFLKNFEVFDDYTCIIKFRLLFILLFIHLRKDYQVYKTLTSNDFLCNDVLMRLSLKKLYRINNLFTTSINQKYQILNGDPVKNFALKEICSLITNGMKYISIEENQDEFEIGLKILCFMLKKLMFDKNDLILLIDSLYGFYQTFYDYMMAKKTNIYALIDIFYAIIEICFMITVNYNDLVIEENLEDIKSNFPDIFIINTTNHSKKLLIIIFKNCEIIKKHYDLLIKPEADKKSEEEKIREEKLRKNFFYMQQKILSKTTGVTQKVPDNGGLFKNKILNLFNETLSIFSLTDNSYQRQLENITEEDVIEYDTFIENINDKNFYKIMYISKGVEHSNILLNLKIVLEEVYYTLFTTSYFYMEKQLEKNLRTRILNACDEINKNIEELANNKYKRDIKRLLENEEKLKKESGEKEFLYLSEQEIIIRKILKDISVNINFAKNNFLLFDKGRELLVDNLIISQIDETLFKGLIFLTNIKYPNIITPEIVRLYFHFLGLFLLTKRGVKYILLGKNIQNIVKLIHRLRYEANNKNVIESKGRTSFFNVNSIKVVIHYLCLITKFVKIYNIKAAYQHKSLQKLQKNLVLHIKYFANHVDNENSQIEFKQQLRETLEIFNNLYQLYTYNEFEAIKYDFIDIFKNCPMKLLNPDIFQKWFDKDSINYEDINFKKRRKWDLAFYFQFFELISKNQFYVYNNDVYGKKCIGWLLVFIDIENLSDIMNNNYELFTYEQKAILMNFIRIYYTLDYLDQIDYLEKNPLLTTSLYKYMIKNKVLKDKKIMQYFKDIKTEEENKDNKKKKKKKKKKTNGKVMNKKFDYIQEFIILLNIYCREIERFPNIIIKEPNIHVQNFIIEIIFAIHDLSNIVYYNNNLVNIILPHYYKLVINFLKKKPVLLKMFNDSKNSKKIINPDDYKDLLEEKNLTEDYKYFIKKDINIFDKEALFKCVIKNVFEIYKNTNINNELKLEVYFRSYDLFNEQNFPPFSLIEVKDYEYFYESYEKEIKKKYKNKNFKKLDILRTKSYETYKDIGSLAFIDISSGRSSTKNIDYSQKFVNLFKSYINSVESKNLTYYRTFLCIMDKLLLYDSEHVQSLIQELAYDKYFFKNLNRELNNRIVQYINSSKKYNLCYGCAKITDITKITIQFLQLLGEGFNTNFHENILKGVTKKREKKRRVKGENVYGGNNSESDEEGNENDDESVDLDIKDELVDKAVNITVKREMNKRREIPFVETDKTVYESMIYYLRLIYHLMNLNNLVEGELAFDKLCILTANIIDFLIEYIDTKKNLEHIIDDYMKSLFFGKEKYNDIDNGNKYMKYKGVYGIILMKIKDDDKDLTKYLLRKIVLTFIKMKYFQLLNSYLLLGTKNDFVHTMIEYHLGPFQLFEQIVYYMAELINHLVNINYRKYKHLLYVDDVESYINELNDLYTYDEDFRGALEMELILKISLFITIIEEFYKINMLSELFNKKEKFQDNNLLPEENQEELNSNDDSKNLLQEFKEEESESEISIQNPKNFIKYYGPHPETFRSEVNLIEEYNLETIDANNYIFVTNKPYFQNISETPYKFVRKNHIKMMKKRIKEEKEKKKILEKTIKTKIEDDYLKPNSKFVRAVYLFVMSHISKVEIRMSSNGEDKKGEKEKEENNEKSQDFKLISAQISKEFLKVKKDKEIQSAIEQKEIENDKKNKNKKNGKDNLDMDDQENREKNEEESENIDEDEENKKISFFIRPYLSFHLSEQTKNYFINNVDRSNITNKYSSLITFSDYCAFEMMYNMLYINNSFYKKKLAKIELSKMQVINYIFILIENILLMYHYYRGPSLTHDIYDVIDKSILNKIFFDVWVVLIIKLSIIGFVFIVYFSCKFVLVYQRNIIMKQDKNFIFRKLGQPTQNMFHPTIVNYFSGNGSLLDTMELINKSLGVFTKIRIVLIDSLIANLEINIFFFSLVLNVLFIFSGNPIILSIELLFIVGIFPSLLNILRAFTSKFSNIMICLFFTYCIIYIYSWLSIFYLRNSIDFGNAFDYASGQEIDEPFCHSSVQCLLMLVSYGTRSGGGIGDDFPVISFKNDFNSFISRFFYDMTFYILIIMIMANVTFGLIVDSFGALRDESYRYEKDQNNICFICQISRDGCLLKNINFDSHVQNEHNIWNYVDFLCYLHFYDANNFTKVESFVWDKLIDKNYEWIPIDADNAAVEDIEDE